MNYFSLLLGLFILICNATESPCSIRESEKSNELNLKELNKLNIKNESISFDQSARKRNSAWENSDNSQLPPSPRPNVLTSRQSSKNRIKSSPRASIVDHSSSDGDNSELNTDLDDGKNCSSYDRNDNLKASFSSPKLLELECASPKITNHDAECPLAVNEKITSNSDLPPFLSGELGWVSLPIVVAIMMFFLKASGC